MIWIDNGTNFYMILYHWQYLCNTGLTLPSRWGRWPAEESVLTNCIASNFPGVNTTLPEKYPAPERLSGPQVRLLAGRQIPTPTLLWDIYFPTVDNIF